MFRYIYIYVIGQRGVGNYDYSGSGYDQGPEGMYYPPPPPPGLGGHGSMYNVYEQHSPSSTPPVSGPSAAGTHGPPHPPVPAPVWYAPPMTGGGGMARRPGLLEVSAVVPPRYASGGQNRSGPESSSSCSRPSDTRGPARKSN